MLSDINIKGLFLRRAELNLILNNLNKLACEKNAKLLSLKIKRIEIGLEEVTTDIYLQQ